MAVGLEVRLLGPFEVLVDDQQVRVVGRLRSLLAALALRTSVVGFDDLIAAVWEEHERPSDPRRSLQVAVVRLRALIGGGWIETGSGGYRLTGARVDAMMLLQATKASRSTVELDEVLSCWRGEPLQGVPSALLESTAGPRLTESYLSILERRIDVDLAEGRYAGLVTELRDLAERYPLRESLWVRLIDLLDRSGRRAEALACYEDIRQRIADELGVAPSQDLRSLHGDLLAADGAPARAEGSGVPRQLPRKVPRFVGRAENLEALDAALAQQPSGLCLTLSGPPGVGKTSLALEWSHRVAEAFPDGQLFVDLGGYGIGDPLSSGQALELMLQGLGFEAGRIPSSTDARGALLRTSLADRQLLLVLDDARNADQVRPLLPSSGTVLVTSRSQLRSLTAREGAVRIAVDGFSPTEARTFLSRSIPVPVGSRPAADELARWCDHLPLALAVIAEHAERSRYDAVDDLLAEFRRHPYVLDMFDLGDDQQRGLRASLASSYDALPPDAACLFRLLGRQPGHSMTLTAVVELAKLRRAVLLTSLDRLEEAHLLRRTGPDHFELSELMAAYAEECALPVLESGVTGVKAVRRRRLSA
ncbi:BTAD domain-containing putative transcriptional regulator [Kribbella sp. NPDC056861]|uniref:AfsR/SARP family transcriptional regulator n=1 Tax=Kribbella sp. NPDC056861 TaxID=3154857 RepID=UPI003422854E